MADTGQKKLWPMVKTHKSGEIAFMQQKYGASGFLCGTLDECEFLMRSGIKNIMYAYPVAGEPNISSVPVGFSGALENTFNNTAPDYYIGGHRPVCHHLCMGNMAKYT